MITAMCLWFNCLKPLPGEVTGKLLFCQSPQRGLETAAFGWGPRRVWGVQARDWGASVALGAQEGIRGPEGAGGPGEGVGSPGDTGGWHEVGLQGP